jgi:breast cancer 2 susceptibility protein
MPSMEALKKAQQKMKVWEKDWDVLDEPADDEVDETPLPEIPLPVPAKDLEEAADELRPTQLAPQVSLAPAAPIPFPAFSSAAAFSTPARPSPLGFSSQPKAFRVPTFKNVASNSTSTPLASRVPPRSQSAFRPPLSASAATPGPSSIAFRAPLRSAPPGPSQTPSQPSSRLNHEAPSTPLRQVARSLLTTTSQATNLFTTPRSVGLSRSSKATFKTPFKVPGSTQNPAQQILKQNRLNHTYVPPSPLNPASTQTSTPVQKPRYPEQPTFRAPSKSTPQKPIANPATGTPKTPLVSCGLRPQEYDAEDLSSMGV